MSDSHEPSYYEIALTNRQVLVAFVVLLLSILGAFVGGVWLGRGGAEPADIGPIVEVDDAPVDLEGVEELTFFSDREGDDRDTRRPTARDESRRPPPPPLATPPPSSPPPPRDSTAETTLAQDIGVDRAVPPRSQAPPRDRESQDTGSQNSASSDTGSRDHAPREDRGQPAPPTSQPADAARASGPGFVIQVFSGRDETQARQVLKRLRGDGREAFLSPVAVGSLTMFRVRVGPFGDRARADRAASEITKKHKLDTWITAVE